MKRNLELSSISEIKFQEITQYKIELHNKFWREVMKKILYCIFLPFYFIYLFILGIAETIKEDEDNEEF